MPIALDWLLLLTSGTVLVLSLLSGLIVNRLWISEVTLCLLFGAALAASSTYWMHGILSASGQLSNLELVARLTLGVAVMGVALRLPFEFFRTRWRDLAVVLGLALPLMWLTSALIAYVCLGLAILPALLVGATVAPTDPVVAQSIVSGKIAEHNVPGRVRRLIAGESAANDALGIMIVMLPLLLMQHEPKAALADWLVDVLVRDVAMSIIVGAVLGGFTGVLFVRAKTRDYSEDRSMLVTGVALAFTSIATLQLLGGDGIVGSFVAGLVFNRRISGLETRQHHLSAALSRFFDLPVFILIGLYLPWREWMKLGWSGLIFAAAILVFRRLPWILLLGGFTRSLRHHEERIFTGWFGPIGVAAAFYALQAEAEGGMEWLWPITSLAIFASVLVHGTTATPLARRLGSRLARHRDGE
ncbi:cation:proton antiporter [Stakelama saccharophila]|uniref:Cation:proton antiporter n=1 Tax=Stakelama saccharophila TaxID=3075605 RepID=A0ABZ0B781_9SPHN|nr:cation:proton antiporter [Stakelama sp. W311]WNO52855.1 cation:proton antiporter [Stakelama sp. W311]